ncbi:MAG TPA: hypothetical protein VFE17_07285, partial [Candidatus Baltobacteraceae bacterium]|nr:hypothetical protein [Candidatus Baltobacteraceae bacterium]
AAWNIRAFDATHSSRLVSPRCAYTGHGLFWKRIGMWRYAARGKFEVQAAARFVGPCMLSPW